MTSARVLWLTWPMAFSISLFRAGAFLSLVLVAAMLPAQTDPCPKPARDYWKPDAIAGDLQFDVPAGWEKIDDQGTLELAPAMQQGRPLTRIGFLAPTTLHGNARQYFEAVWAQLRTRMNMIDNGDPTLSHTSRGFDVITRYSRVYAPSIGNGKFWLALAVMGDRAEAYFYIDNTNNTDYDQAYDAFQHSVQFTNQAKPELAEPGIPCGLSGIYLGWKAGSVVMRPGMLIATLVFFPDGNVIRHLPQQGLKNFDFGEEIKKSRDSCGRYRTIGDQVRITWADGNRAVGNRDGANLNFEGLPYLAAANSDGLKLNATYRTGSAPTGPRIRFTPDGRFVENGILDSIDYHGGDKAPGGGTYNIEQNTIELHYSTGQYVPLSFYVFANDPGPRPKLIHLNSRDFVLTE